MTAITPEERQIWADIRQTKVNMLAQKGTARTLDLFAGCGGISLGYHRAGFEIKAGVEIDKYAAKTHALNFHAHLGEDMQEKHGLPRDVTQLEPEDIVRELHLGNTVPESIDMIVGGPPCQAFARVGRSKLREVYDHPEAFKIDPRSNLYLRYLDYVKAFQPLAIMMENVPDVLNFGGHNIAEEVCEALEDMGYVAKYTLMNSVYFGVPEMRERMILIAYAQELNIADVTFPEPTHYIDLPRGYHSSRQVALKTVQHGCDAHHYVELTKPTEDLASAITAEEALIDLPRIPNDHRCKLRKAPQRFTTLDPYPNVELNDYAQLMRHGWSQFGNDDGGVFDHLIRFLPRDYPIFARMAAGDQYPEAHRVALAMFEEALAKKRDTGKNIAEASEEYEALMKSIVPPYDPGKFPNKWRKMEPNQPARTLMAHLGKDSYSHIHYDSTQARTISIREAARLQSFPDGFKYAGSMNPAFKQIGNAVPPLMAFAVASHIREQLNF
ncbi:MULTISPECIES: DNA cytosine methyltransferase [unclassified Agarivorans]|uniref:DNA cytosine methyltransferase n=1 Tax=unclassified Agarivorans TaxID=2636026 RepID=UPI0026E3C1A2|nr:MULTISPECIES: DNA cytosine methyltransferase [unclassified Agarivorans]MDO6686726.1 DNA cytosine methyltransferase [Agarivorans sp. 3_MG-2023]MDO6716544.1 DNA cytosine methyltransferase [Agarivorans sp. 2_MG-2023]